MAIKQIKTPDGTSHDIHAVYDGDGNNIKNTYSRNGHDHTEYITTDVLLQIVQESMAQVETSFNNMTSWVNSTFLPLAGGNLIGELKFDTGTTQSATKGIKWTAIGNNTPYIGYATDQVDGTFVLGSLKGTGYQTGLAIGGGSGNLLWKGVRVATVNDIPAYTDTNTSHNHSAGVGLTASGSAGTGGGTYIYSANLRSTTALSVSSAAATTTSGRVYPVAVDKDGYLAVNVPWTAGTATGPSVTSVSISTGSSNGTIKYSINGETATSVSVKGLNTAAYQPSTAFAPAYEYSTTDLTAGTSSLSTGKLYFVYEQKERGI